MTECYILCFMFDSEVNSITVLNTFLTPFTHQNALCMNGMSPSLAGPISVNVFVSAVLFAGSLTHTYSFMMC